MSAVRLLIYAGIGHFAIACGDTSSREVIRFTTQGAVRIFLDEEEFFPTKAILNKSDEYGDRIWFCLSESGVIRWLRLEQKGEFHVEVGAATLGKTDPLFPGAGKGAACFRIEYDDREAFEKARDLLR